MTASGLWKYVSSPEGLGTLIVTLVGVLIAQLLSEAIVQWKSRRDAASDRATVRNALGIGMAMSLMQIARHRHFLNSRGIPSHIRIVSQHYLLDPFRAAQSTGVELYGRLMMSHALVLTLNNRLDHLDALVRPLVSDAMASHGQSEDVAREVLRPYKPELDMLMQKTEDLLWSLLKDIDHARYLETARAHETQQQDPHWMT